MPEVEPSDDVVDEPVEPGAEPVSGLGAAGVDVPYVRFQGCEVEGLHSRATDQYSSMYCMAESLPAVALQET